MKKGVSSITPPHHYSIFPGDSSTTIRRAWRQDSTCASERCWESSPPYTTWLRIRHVLPHFSCDQKTHNLSKRIDSLVKSQKTSFFVIPAKAGIQCFQKLMTDLDPGFRRGDDFLRGRQNYISDYTVKKVSPCNDIKFNFSFLTIQDFPNSLDFLFLPF